MTETMLQNALRLRREGRLQDAARIYAQVLAVSPKNYAALHAYGTLRYQTGDLEGAERLIAAAVEANPRATEAMFNRGCLLQQLGRLNEALSAFTGAIAIKPDYVEALINRGNTFLRLKQDEQALADFEAVTHITPQLAHGWHNRGGALIRLGRFEEAQKTFDRLLSVNPRNVEAWIGRSVASFKMGEFRQALSDADHALAINPESAQAWEARGNALSELGRYADAIDAYSRSLPGAPGNGEVYYHRGLAALQLRRYGDAMRDFESAIALDPHHESVRGDLLLARLFCCEWHDAGALKKDVVARLHKGVRAANPFAALLAGDPAAPDANAERAAQEGARLATAFRYPPRAPLAKPGRRSANDKIRIAYVSADFAEHPVARLIAGVIESHDRSWFEIMALSLGKANPSPMRTRLENAFDRFENGHALTDAEAASLLHEWDTDVAVDLMGYTQGNRTGIFALRPAPVQVNWLGFPGTMGAPYYDYLIADSIAIPDSSRGFYDEKIVTLPHTYLPHDRSRAIASPPSRRQAGLPEDAFVFAAFNNPYKFTREMYSIWMDVLGAVEGSVLWLSGAPEIVKDNLRREAASYAIVPERLIFAPYVESDAEHLARLSLADLFLDTLPYNAHASALDALWTGVPVLTARGSTFAGRVAASLLHAAGLPELVTDSLDTYRQAAIRIGTDRVLARVLKAKLSEARKCQPLFDTGRFTRDLEAAFTMMWARNRQGVAPDCFAVPLAAPS